MDRNISITLLVLIILIILIFIYEIINRNLPILMHEKLCFNITNDILICEK